MVYSFICSNTNWALTEYQYLFQKWKGPTKFPLIFYTRSTVQEGRQLKDNDIVYSNLGSFKKKTYETGVRVQGKGR